MIVASNFNQFNNQHKMTDFKNMTLIQLRKYIKENEDESETTELSKCNKQVLIEWCEAIECNKIPKTFSYFAFSNIGD